MQKKAYIAIDLKSFYASVECMERGMDPLNTNLVVADESRTAKTICLAVSPSLKSYGIPGRPRLFEVIRKIQDVNNQRRLKTADMTLKGSSYKKDELDKDPSLEVDYIVAKPQMAHYMQVSAQIYKVYLKYIAPEDIHVYSIDEVFIDATNYLRTYEMTARELAMKMILDVLKTTGITATAGVGTNLYLAKIAMDIEAKHLEPDENGVRIAELDEMSYRRSLWTHRPLTDFWRVGKGYARKLEKIGIFTMGDIARCSLGRSPSGRPSTYYTADLLFDLFGINAELLIDHAWGWEPCTIKEIKEYKPQDNSLGAGQVLQEPYTFEKAKLVTREMTDLLVLDLVDKGIMTNQIVLTVDYDTESLKPRKDKPAYSGEIVKDRYGRQIPKHAHGTANLKQYSSSTKEIVHATMELYDRIVNEDLLVRKITIAANHVLSEAEAKKDSKSAQMSLFSEDGIVARDTEKEDAEKEKEKRIQHTVLDLKKKFGKNAILKGMNLEDGATAKDRNEQIGGHKA